MAAANTLNAATADVAQFFVGSTAARNSSVTANLEVVSAGAAHHPERRQSGPSTTLCDFLSLSACRAGVRNAAPTGEASLLLPGRHGRACRFQQFISFNNRSGLANLAIEPNIGESSDGEIFGYGFGSRSSFDRIGGAKDQVGFIAQDVQASRPLGETMCKVKNWDGRELIAKNRARSTRSAS